MLINRAEAQGHDAHLRPDTFHPGDLPAAYAVYATNEAEKAANINVVRVQGASAFGRVCLAGEADVLSGGRGGHQALEAIGASRKNGSHGHETPT
jgi:hypothetical protein